MRFDYKKGSVSFKKRGERTPERTIMLTGKEKGERTGWCVEDIHHLSTCLTTVSFLLSGGHSGTFSS
jgi:hypothetical protein